MIYELKKKVIVRDCQIINKEIDLKMTFNEPLSVSNPYSDGILPTGYFYPITAIFSATVLSVSKPYLDGILPTNATS